MVGEMVKKLGWGRLLISCNYSCTFYSSVKILLVKLKNLHTSACLQLNCCTTKYKPKMWRLQIWWNSSKLVTNTLVNFGNCFNYIILSPSFCSGKNAVWKKAISSENTVWEEWAIPVCLGDNDKNLGESFAWGHEWNWADSIFWLTNVFAVVLTL